MNGETVKATGSTCHERGETRVRWRKREDGLEECVQFVPGYNCPVEGGSGHGVHGMEVRWFLRGRRRQRGVARHEYRLRAWRRSPGRGLSPNGRYEHWDLYPGGFGARVPRSRPGQYEVTGPWSLATAT